MSSLASGKLSLLAAVPVGLWLFLFLRANTMRGDPDGAMLLLFFVLPAVVVFGLIGALSGVVGVMKNKGSVLNWLGIAMNVALSIVPAREFLMF